MNIIKKIWRLLTHRGYKMKRIVDISGLDNVKAFIDRFGAMALEAEQVTGISALAMLGQSALETGWGKYVLWVIDNEGNRRDTQNLFNIKKLDNWTGESGYRVVNEFVGGKQVNSREYFRIYSSFQDSFADYANYIFNRKLPSGELRYAKAIAVKDDFRKYITEIAKAGYATDPSYAPKIIKTIEQCFKVVTVDG